MEQHHLLKVTSNHQLQLSLVNVQPDMEEDGGDMAPPSGENTDDKNWPLQTGGTRPEIYIKSQSLRTKVCQLIDLYLIKTLTHLTPDRSQ